MEERWTSCDRTVDGGAQGNQVALSQKRKGENRPASVPETKSNVCDRAEGSDGHAKVPRNAGSTPMARGVSTNGSGATVRGLGVGDRRASLELRCLGIPVGRSGGGSGMRSSLVISKVNPGSGSSRQGYPVKDASHADAHRRNVEEMVGGCDVSVVSKEKPPQAAYRVPDGHANRPDRPRAYHNGEGPLHPAGIRPVRSAAPLEGAGSATVSRAGVADGRMVPGASPPPSTRKASLGEAQAIGQSISSTLESAVRHLGSRGQANPLGSRRNGDVAMDVQVRSRGGAKPMAVVSDGRDVLSFQRQEGGGILDQILGNGEITLTPRSQPREDGGQRSQGTKRAVEETGFVADGQGHQDKRMMLEAVNLMERGYLPEIRRKPESEMRMAKSVDPGRTPVAAYGSSALRVKENRVGRDEITIEPIVGTIQSSFAARRERFLGKEGQVRPAAESFASRYPLLREGLSKPCLRRRGRPPKSVLPVVGRSRRSTDARPSEYAAYHVAQPQVPCGLNLPEGTVVNPLVQTQHRKTMSVDEVLTYYGTMQERKVSNRESDSQRVQPREISMAVSPETSMPSMMQNSSLAKIESLVQKQVPSATGFFPANPPPTRYSHLPSSPPGIQIVPGFPAHMGPYAGQQMVLQDPGLYAVRSRGRGRPRGRARARGRPRGNSGLYYHSTDREILPKPDYMPRHAEDVEEIVVEVDFKPEWDDEREMESAKDDSLSEAQRLVPNWISVVPAKMPPCRRPPAAQPSGEREPPVPGWGAAQRQVVVPERAEVRPSVEAMPRRLKQSIPAPMPRAEENPADTTTDASAKAVDRRQRSISPEQQPEVPDAEPEEPIGLDSDSDGDDDNAAVEMAEDSISEEDETAKVGANDGSSSEDKVEEEAEEHWLEKAPSPSSTNSESNIKEVEVKVEVPDESEEDSVSKEDEIFTENERTLRENRNRFHQLASSLASIKSLPKDVTVVRSRGKGSAFEGYGHPSTSPFPNAVAARLGPSIEIRRVGGGRREVANAGEPEDMANEAEERGEEGESKDEDLLSRIPGLSSMLSVGTTVQPTAVLANSVKEEKEEEEEEAVEDEEEGEKMEDEQEAEKDEIRVPTPEVTDLEEEPEECSEEKDRTYRASSYRGAGRRRRNMPKPRRKHGRRKAPKTLARVKLEEEERPGDWDVFVCDLCGRSFSKRFRLAHHIRAYHPREGTSKGEDGRRVFPCQQCSKAFTRKANLKKHLRIHTGEKPFVCEECGRAFTFSKNLAQHRRVHGMERPFVCEVCGHAFRFSKNLSQHRGVHAHLKPHVCNVCGRGFTRSTHLSQHKRLHSGEKPFRCSVCGKRFAQRGHAALHTRIHTGERPYACPVCGRAFSLRAHLVRHVALHQRDGEMGPGRPPPLPRRDRRGRDGVELVGAAEERGGGEAPGRADHPADDDHVASFLEGEFAEGIVDLGEEEEEEEGVPSEGAAAMEA